MCFMLYNRQNNGQPLINANKLPYIFMYHAKKLFFLAFFKKCLYVCNRLLQHKILGQKKRTIFVQDIGKPSKVAE